MLQRYALLTSLFSMLTLIVSGCATVQLSQEAKNIREFKGQYVGDCQFLGRHKAWAENHANNTKSARNFALNYSADLGANWIMFEPPSVNELRTVVYAQSFNCKSNRMALKQACDKGNSQSCVRWNKLAELANADVESFYSLQKACEFGNDKACDRQIEGKKKAQAFAEKCESGHGESCMWVGYYYYLMQDNNALYWYGKGCEQGHNDSCTYKDKLSSMIEQNEESQRELSSIKAEEAQAEQTEYYNAQVRAQQRQQNVNQALTNFSNYLNQQNQPAQSQNRNVNCQSRAQYDIYGKFLGYRTNCN